ncbi:hypothetical protein Btru_057462 [Bulinus truncatus]|nr:hypothetical protein Btru_057462 [Bulinus truncatus]
MKSIFVVLFIFGAVLDKAIAKPSFCSLPVEPGKCFGYFEMFYYDSESDSCKDFIYGGCQGNENRFVSLEECEELCK